MAVEYTYDHENGMVKMEARGIISARDMCNYVSEIIGRADVASGFIEVVDLEKVEDFQFMYSDTYALKSLWIQFCEKGCRCSIIYAPTDCGYGLMRMLQAVLSVDEDTENPHFVVVRTREEVLECIKKVRT